MLSLVGLPLVVANVREGLQAIPNHVREASYALGKTKIATTRRVLLPAARPSVLTGAMLGAGRVIGDTAIIVVLLGGTLTFNGSRLYSPALDPAWDRQHADLLRLLQRADRRGQSAHQGLRGRLRPACDRAGAERRGRLRHPSFQEAEMEHLKPPPIRRLTGNESMSTHHPRPGPSGNGNGNGNAAAPAPRRRRRPATHRSRRRWPSTACRSLGCRSPTAASSPLMGCRCRFARAKCWA